MEGVKILENEISEETYWYVLDQYDSGMNFPEILQQKSFESDLPDPVDAENHVIGYALAAWEIGFLSPELLNITKSIISKNASVKDWSESFSEAMGKARAKELQKFLEKITAENPKIRKPKKYKSVSNYLFQINDVLSFNLPNKNHVLAIVLNITELRGVCTYYLGKLVYNRPELPDTSMLSQLQIVGDKGSSKGGILALSLFNPDEDAPFGLYMITIEHKKFSKFSQHFKKIGNIPLKEDCKTASSVSTSSSFEDLILKFNTPEAFYKVSRNKVYTLEDLVLIPAAH